MAATGNGTAAKPLEGAAVQPAALVCPICGPLPGLPLIYRTCPTCHLTVLIEPEALLPLSMKWMWKRTPTLDQVAAEIDAMTSPGR